MTNKGVEFTLNTRNILTHDFTWTSGLTFSINRNEVTKLYSESSAISGINGNETLTYTMVGEPVGSSTVIKSSVCSKKRATSTRKMLTATSSSTKRAIAYV